MTTDFDEYDYLEQQVEKKADEAAPKEEPSNGDTKAAKEEVKEKEKDGERGKDRSDRKSRDRSRDRDKDRSRSEKRSRRDRSRSSSRRHRSRDKDSERSKDKVRSRSRDKDRRRRSRSRERKEPPARRERTPPEVRAQRERERELEALERDTRTVFASNLNTRANDMDIFEFFSKAGTVMDVRIITDRNTKRSKGFAYIEMSNKMEVASALSLTGQPLLGQAVMIKASEAEKNMAWEANQAQQQQQQQAMAAQPALAGLAGVTVGPVKLQVTNVHPNVADADLESIFSPFGALDFAQIVKDAAGGSTGAAFVQYKNAPEAIRAVQELNDLEIAGLKIQVSLAPVVPLAGAVPAAPVVPVNVNDLDDEDGGGLRMTAQSRAALMARLSGASNIPGFGGSGANTVPVGSGANNIPLGVPPGPPALPTPAAAPVSSHPLAHVQGVLGPASPIPTNCLLLKNMFDPETETEPEWDLEIGEDVKDECSKYGPVVHHFVDKTSKGFVYLKFAATDAAQKAQMTLNGRWFAGKEVLAEFQFTTVYDSYFKC